MPIVEGGAEFEKLTHWHAVNLIPMISCSAEKATVAVGGVVGCDSVNGVIVIFTNSTSK